eukprot:1161892-Pelagomonas_calceolata.AAC.9
MQQARAGQIKATKEVILIRLAQEDERRNAYPGEEERLPWTFASTPGSLTQSDILCPGHLRATQEAEAPELWQGFHQSKVGDNQDAEAPQNWQTPQ